MYVCMYVHVCMYVPQSLENPCTNFDQTRTTYSPWPPMVIGGRGQGHLRSKVTWGKILKFAGEFNQGHQRSFQGHHHISKTPAPILTKLTPGVALDRPMVIGVRVKVTPHGYRGQGQGHPMSKVMWGSNLQTMSQFKTFLSKS